MAGRTGETDAPRGNDDSAPEIQCFVVVDPLLRPLNGIQVIKEFVAQIPEACPEARAANGSGSFHCDREFPGIPTRKFSKADENRAKQNPNKDWAIQALYPDGSDPEKLLMLYEGWTCNFLEKTTRTKIKNMGKTVSSMLKDLEDRQEFIKLQREAADIKYEKLKREQGDYDPQADKEQDPEYKYLFFEPKPESNPKSPFWYFEDLSYFHSFMNSAHHLAPVLYMALCKTRPGQRALMPPTYAYTARNIVPRKVFDFLMKQPFQKCFDELKQGRRFFFNIENKPRNGCSSRRCVCGYIVPMVYRKIESHTISLKFTDEGRLVFPDYIARKAPIVIECSDRCGCDANCPRRTLQRGQKKTLVVNYEQGIGYGLRTAERIEAGELICELTGEMMLNQHEPTGSTRKKRLIEFRQRGVKRQAVHMEDGMEVDGMEEDGMDWSPNDVAPEKTLDSSYDTEFSVMTRKVTISALTVGNIARFVNHSCSPNAMFVEVHSRRSEKDPLIPRIGMFAINDIQLGEQITISYWRKGNNVKRSSMVCRCGAPDCIGFLPSSSK